MKYVWLGAPSAFALNEMLPSAAVNVVLSASWRLLRTHHASTESASSKSTPAATSFLRTAAPGLVHLSVSVRTPPCAARPAEMVTMRGAIAVRTLTYPLASACARLQPPPRELRPLTSTTSPLRDVEARLSFMPSTRPRSVPAFTGLGGERIGAPRSRRSRT